MQMTSNKLDGTNYSAWSQFVQLYVTGKGKLGYLTGEKIKPAISDPSFSTWVEENAMFMSWLLNSMTPDINASFLRLPTAHDIWDAVAQTYFTSNDASQIYELRRKAHETRQQGKSLASYFSALQTICTYAFVRREELCQAAMLTIPPQALMTIQQSPSALVSSGSWKPKDKESLFCTHYKGTKHTWETCIKLNDYPNWFRSTDHMTHESSNFSSYNTYPSKRCVKTANGSSSAVSGDFLTGTMIGLGRERDGLYYLDLNWHAKDDTGQSEEKSWNVLPTLELNSMPSSGLTLDSREQVSLDQSNDQLVVPVTGNPEAEIVSFLEPTTLVDSHVDDSNIPISSHEPTTLVDSHVDDSNMPIALRKSTRACPSIYRYPISNYVSSHRLSPSCKAFANQLSFVSVPKNLQDALNNPRWKAAIVEEMEALQKNSTWKLVKLPKDKKTVDCKWVFTVKHKADGSIERFKARLVAKGYTQTYEEEVYMGFPPGFSTSLESGKNQSDHTLFLKDSNEGKITALIVYVDDIVVTGNDTVEIGKLKTYLAKEFEIKDLGTLRYFLGIEVARSKEGIFVSQRKYVLDLLVEMGMLACKPIDTPIEQNHKLGEDIDDTPVDRERYQKLVGKLIYLSHTRPDIAYALSVVSQFMHAPCEKHMEAVHRILRYLKSAPEKCLMLYKNGHLEVEGYTDADWAGSVTDRRSTSRSSAKAEFRAMAHGICEMLWLKAMLKELGVHSKDPIKLYCDNKAAISICSQSGSA
uniref:Reverse transcriptase Ty1/copia-type domain-containing protein n=1 Tax=Fagus sylvatica TaxID=28930 RepID=A0A2N9I5Z3_FAGSY